MKRELRIGRLVSGICRSDGLRLTEMVDLHHPGRDRPLGRGPGAEPRGRGWYIADAENREVSCAVYISKRAAVAAIRAMLGAAASELPLFYTVK